MDFFFLSDVKYLTFQVSDVDKYFFNHNQFRVKTGVKRSLSKLQKLLVMVL